MKKKLTMVFAMMVTGCFLLGASGNAFAESQWAKKHPRRHQVNQRLKTQNLRIHDQVKEGELTKTQAQALHHEDRQIRQEERDMASQNGGHITKQEQKTLNHQENGTSGQIGY